MEDELIGRAKNGDRQAFGQILSENYDFIHAVAWRWTGNAADADDVTQDVCLRLGKTIRSFRGEGRLRTWLYTLTLNTIRDRARKYSRERKKTAAYFDDPTMAPIQRESDGQKESDGQTESDAEDATTKLWEAVRRLPTKQCNAVMLVYAEGLSHSAAADVLGCSESTISWHVHEARKRLRDLLGQEMAQG